MTQRLLWPLTDVAEVLDLYQRGRASTARHPRAARRAGRPSRRATASLARPVAGPRSSCAGSGPATPTAPTCCTASTSSSPRARRTPSSAPPGAGKSTLLRLVLRFDDPRDGQVLLDGDDVRDLDWDSLRGSIGYVAQDVFLFAGTVARQHRLRPARRHPRARSRGAAEAAAAARLHRGAARRATTPSVGERGVDPLRRAAAAARPGPGAAARPRGPRARRGHQRGRQRDRGRHPALAAGRASRAAPRSSSPTGSRPSGTPTGSGCSTAAGSSRPAPTTSWSPRGGAYAALWAVQTGELVEDAGARPAGR